MSSVPAISSDHHTSMAYPEEEIAIDINGTGGSADASENVVNQDPAMANISSGITQRLYISHFLSTWNTRSFEFGAVLFLASIFPMTLLPLSIYALVRSASAVFLAPVVGRAIDTRRRLPVVRFSIVLGRISVAVSCIAFWLLTTYGSLSFSTIWAIFSMLVLISCLEKPCSILNLIAVERDWVVVIAGNNSASLQTMNARLRRIDLFCKLAGPLFIALIDGASTEIAVLVTLAISVVSIPIEYFAIAQVYHAVPSLQFPREIVPAAIPIEGGAPRVRSWRFVPSYFCTIFEALQFYCRHRAFLPSLALSLLYFTVLSFSGQMVTFLISAGYKPFEIALVRTVSVVFELSATWIAPKLMTWIGPARAGMWFLSWQMLWLGAATSFFWAEPLSIAAASGLATGTILSRIGLWGYDLCAQFIIQDEVQDSLRGSFSSTEASLQNAFELLSYATTIACSRPDQFRYPVLLSAIAVYSAAFLFGKSLRERRGHLVHIPACIQRKRSAAIEVTGLEELDGLVHRIMRSNEELET